MKLMRLTTLEGATVLVNPAMVTAVEERTLATFVPPLKHRQIDLVGYAVQVKETFDEIAEAFERTYETIGNIDATVSY